MVRSLKAGALVALVALATGCIEPANPELPSPVVPRDPKAIAFKSSMRRFSEEMRVAANRFELGMSRTDAEFLLDDLKSLCSRIPDPPSADLQPQREECVRLVRQLDATIQESLRLDAERRQAERVARMTAGREELRSGERLAIAEWLPAEEQAPPGAGGAIAQIDALKAETVRQGVALLRFRNEQLRDAIGPGPFLARETGVSILR